MKTYFSIDASADSKLNITRPLDNGMQIEQACHGYLDYAVQSQQNEGSIIYAGAERIGKRRTQEDRMVHFDLSEIQWDQFRQLSKIEKTRFINEIFSELAQEVEAYQAGATGLISIVDPITQSSWLGHVGDSQALKIVVKNNSLVEFKKLNSLHHPDMPSEQIRVEASKQGFVSKHRVQGQLAVSRALGDKKFQPHGLISLPEINYVDLSVGDNETQCFYLHACDGLFERCSEEEIAQWVAANCTLEPVMMAQKLSNLALESGSRDNVSIQLIQQGVGAIFDGHGGDEVAEHCFQELEAIFYRALNKQMEHKHLKEQYDGGDTPLLESDAQTPECIEELEWALPNVKPNIRPQTLASKLTLNKALLISLAVTLGGLMLNSLIYLTTQQPFNLGMVMLQWGLGSLSASIAVLSITHLALTVRNWYKTTAYQRINHDYTHAPVFELNDAQRHAFSLGQQTYSSWTPNFKSVISPSLWFNKSLREAYYAGIKSSEEPNLELNEAFKVDTLKPI